MQAMFRERGRFDRFVRWHQAPATAHTLIGAATDKSRRRRACQQDCPDGVGHGGQGRALQGTRRALAIRREDEQHVMQSRSIRRSGQPKNASA